MAGEIYTIQDLVKSISVRINTDGRYRRFQRMYSKDRIAFVYDIMPKLGLTIAPYQIEILGYFDEGYTRVAVRSPHGSGKTTLASVLTHHAILTAEADCKVPTTASAWRQLEKYLWPEIRKSEKMIDWVKVGRDPYDHRTEFLQLSIRLRGGLVEAFALSSDDEQTIEGAHATRLMYIFDEAKAIPRKTWDAAEGAFANANVTTQADISQTMLNIDEYADESIITQAIEQNQSKEVKSIPGIAVYDVLAGRKNKVYNPNTNRLIVPERDSNVISGHGIGSVSANDRHMSMPIGIDSHDSQSNVQRDQSIVPSGQRDQSSQSSGSSLLLPVRSQLSDSRTSESMLGTMPTISRKTLNWHSHHRTHAETVKTNVAWMQQITTYEALALAISTPGNPSGQFYDIMQRKSGYEHWKTKHITLDEAIIAGRINASWAEQMKRQWGEFSSQYQNRVLGNFAEESEESVIPLSWIEAAVDRWIEWNRHGRREQSGIRTLGVDVARLGTDKTVVADRHASVLQSIYSFTKLRTTETSGRVKSLASGKKIMIEMDGGLGAAVYDMLRENDDIKSNLVPITVSSKTSMRDRSGELGFFNVRSAMWWHMRELLDPEQGSDICLPDVDALIGDLSAPKWEMMKDAVVKLESKKDIIARLGRSTDYGDAVCLAFWEQSSGGGVVF